MKTRSFDLDGAVSLGLALGAAVVSVMCSAGAPARPSTPWAAGEPSAPAAPLESAGAAPSAPVASAAPPAPSAPAAVDSSAVPKLALPHFYAALGKLEQHAENEPVRVLWLGDSHTAADYWGQAVRKPLQERFGNAGPGFVMLGLDKSRHGRARTTREGKWRHEPSAPAGSSHQLDGVFGLLGIRVVPASADARLGIELLPDAAKGPVRFSLLYRAQKGDELRVGIRGSSKTTSAGMKSGRAGPSPSPIRRLDVDGDAHSTLDVAVASGAPEVFGVVVESHDPGVVIDTLGIVGARAATPLAWDEASWQAEVKARAPRLLIFAYGTNEAASTLPVARYTGALDKLVTRARAAAADADCLLVGPPDMATADGGSAPRVIEFDRAARETADRLGCGYFSAFDAMGGEGSYARWAKETPPLAWRDHVHLTASGYERIGEAIAKALLAGYAKR